MRTFAAVLDVVKIVLAAPFMLWGVLFGVVGLGPEGFMPLDASLRLTALCILAGALAAAHPFLWMPLPKPAGWIVALLSLLPFALWCHQVLTWGGPNRVSNPSEAGGFALAITVCVVLFPILSIADLLLSYKMKTQV